MTLTLEHAQQIFQNVNGSTFVGLDTKTLVPLRKRENGGLNPMHDKVHKLCSGSSVMVFQNRHGSSYAAMVHRRLAQEGLDDTFELQPRKWGNRIPNTPFIEHEVDGELRHYLEVIFFKAGKVMYLLDNEPIEKDDIIGYKEPVVNPESQGGLMPMHRKVVIRSFAFDSLVGIRVDGQEFVIG